MRVPWTPLRWPAQWKDPSVLSLLQGTAIDYLLIDKDDAFEPVRARAREQGLKVTAPDSPPEGVSIIKGEWPGVHSQRGSGGGTAAGPTGNPWVDSNGWNIRLAGALHPESAVWVQAAPPKQSIRIPPDSYLLAVADSAAHGGRWIITLDEQVAPAIAAHNEEALEAWKRIGAATKFFAAHKPWADYGAAAVFGVVSDFKGDNEFFNQELLNLLARAGGHYRILRKEAIGASSLAGLRAVIYADAEPPSADLRKRIAAFVEAGGMLVTVPKWGTVGGAPAKGESHPRYAIKAAGKGRIAQALADPDDPYVMAQDAVVLLSHRYDLVRFWNGGATAAYYTVTPDAKKAIVHLLFYSYRGPDSASVRIAGPYRSAKAATVDTPELPKLGVEVQKDAVEVHLPQVSQYVAVELEV